MITGLTREALDACVTLYLDTFTAPPWSESWTVEDATTRLGDLLGGPRAHGVCSWDEDGALLGFALGHVERSEGYDCFYLREMCVRPDRHRGGLGTELLDALSGELDHVRQWYLLTLRDSGPAAFYQARGFRAANRMAVFVRP